MKKVSLLILVLSSVLVGCGPSHKEMLSKMSGYELPYKSKGDRIEVYISWMGKDKYNYGDIAYRLDNDNENTAKLFYREYTRITTTPGQHTIHWRFGGKNPSSISKNKASFNFKKENTYVLHHIHGIFFNLYSPDGLDILDSLKLVEDDIRGKYIIFNSTESNLSEDCIKKASISLRKEDCN